MPRPKKNRIVFTMPRCEGFMPLGFDEDSIIEEVLLTVDEYETIRLIDLEHLTQEECANKMNISRPTVTNIYEIARNKIADAFINEKVLLVSGGDYDVCNENKKIAKMKKEKKIMKIAVTYENGQIFQHFGHCENFKVYQIEDGKITNASIENAAGSGHGALAGFLRNLGVDTLICGGIGGGAQNALAASGIRLYGGVMGAADTAVEALIAGTLQYNANVQCNHHGEGHGEGHSCGNHDANHSCGGGHTCGH